MAWSWSHSAEAYENAKSNLDPPAPEAPEGELIRQWREGDFELDLYDTFKTVGHGKARLGYIFRHKGRVIFSGADYGCSPFHSIDGDETVACLLHFLALRPGDTDREYFADYTRAQMDFAMSHGEELWMVAHEMEERARSGEGADEEG